MTKLKRSKWLGHRFSTGITAGEDYLKFQGDSKKDLKKMAEENGLKLHEFNKNHYCFSAVLTDGLGHFIYVSQPDVRFERDINKILIRTMAHEKDWTGGRNNYCSWEEVGKKAKFLIKFCK